MNFLDMLDSQMTARGLNKSTLSKACGIPYTTIDGWYKRGYDGLQVNTLKKLSAYFGVSLDYWLDAEEEKETALNAEAALELSDVDMKLLALPSDVKLMLVQLTTRLAEGTEAPRIELDEMTRKQAVREVRAQESLLQRGNSDTQDAQNH